MTLNNETIKWMAAFSLALCMTSFSVAQTIKVVKKSNRIKGNMAMGYASEVEGKSNEVENAMVKFLKEVGKTRSASSHVSISGPTLGGMLYEGNILYANTTGDDMKSEVWIGIDTAEWRGRDQSQVMERIEKMTYQFALKYYRDLAQKDIDLSQQAFDATEKQKLKLTNQNKDLNSRLVNNEQERIRLEKALELNKLDHAVLLQKIMNNKQSQDSVTNAGGQIKKVMEAQKEKQRKIN